MSSLIHDKILKPSNLNLFLFLLCASSLIFARILLFPNETSDYKYYLSAWVDHLIVNGFDFTENFSNYNFPYLYLLWFGTLFTHDGLIIIKTIGLLSDLLLAFSVYKTIRFYSLSKFWGSVSFLIILALPEVLINSSLWGQTDSLFTSLIIFALYFFVKDKPYYAWLFVGLAFSFKIQTVFILPALIVWFIWKRLPLRSVLPGLVVFGALLIPAWIAGRKWDQLLYAFASQIGNNKKMTVNIPNISVFFDNIAIPGLRSALIFISLSVVCIMIILSIRFKDTLMSDDLSLIKLASISAFVLPFLLPNMLDRYYFVGSMLLVILALLNYQYIILVIAMQLVTVISYTPYLALTVLDNPQTFPVISFPILTLAVLSIIVSMIWIHYKEIIRAKTF